MKYFNQRPSKSKVKRVSISPVSLCIDNGEGMKNLPCSIINSFGKFGHEILGFMQTVARI
jgi:hypothetical protein